MVTQELTNLVLKGLQKKGWTQDSNDDHSTSARCLLYALLEACGKKIIHPQDPQTWRDAPGFGTHPGRRAQDRCFEALKRDSACRTQLIAVLHRPEVAYWLFRMAKGNDVLKGDRAQKLIEGLRSVEADRQVASIMACFFYLNDYLFKDLEDVGFFLSLFHRTPVKWASLV